MMWQEENGAGFRKPGFQRRRTEQGVARNIIIPNLAEFMNEHRFYIKNRTVLVGKVTLDMMASDLIQAHVQKATHFNLQMGSQDNTPGQLGGMLELQFSTVEDAAAAASELEGFDDCVSARHTQEAERKRKDIIFDCVKGEVNFKKNIGCSFLQSEGSVGQRTVVVSGMPKQATLEHLRAAFPTAVDVFWPQNTNGKRESYAYAIFATHSEAIHNDKKKVELSGITKNCHIVSEMPSCTDTIHQIDSLNLPLIEDEPMDAKMLDRLHDYKRAITHYYRVDYITEKQRMHIDRVWSIVMSAIEKQEQFMPNQADYDLSPMPAKRMRPLMAMDTRGSRSAGRVMQEAGYDDGYGGGQAGYDESYGGYDDSYGGGRAGYGGEEAGYGEMYDEYGGAEGSSGRPPINYNKVSQALNLLSGLKDMIGSPVGMGMGGGGRGGQRGARGAMRGRRGGRARRGSYH